MSDIKEQLIADLATDPAYLAMCDMLQGHVDSMEDKLASASSLNDAMRCLRTWQVARAFVNTMKTAPASIKDVLDQELQRDPLEMTSHHTLSDESFFVRRPMLK